MLQNSAARYSALSSIWNQEISYSRIMETIIVSNNTFNGLQKSKLNINGQDLPISYNNAPKSYNQETTFCSPYLNNSQTIPGRKISLQNRTVEDEISIFDAQKYFNEGKEQFPDHTVKLSPVSASEQYDLAEFPRNSTESSSTRAYSARNYRCRSFRATPTASSEVSWNSQTGLLSNRPGTIKVSLCSVNPNVDKRKNQSQRWFFGCNCPCIGKKSIRVNDKTVPSEVRSPMHFRSGNQPSLSKQSNEIPIEKSPAGNTTTLTTPGTHRMPPKKDPFEADQQLLRISLAAGRNNNDGGGISFPILKPPTTSQAVTMTKNQNLTAEEPPRDLLDAFHPFNHELPGQRTMKSNLIDEDDAASDGSSDLFEIESFSTQTNYHIYHRKNKKSLDEASNYRNSRRLSVITSTGDNYRRNSLDEPATPSVGPTEGYEPIEVSIAWSVTTAEGLDRASVATCEDMAERDDGGGRGNSGSRGNGLLGLSCRSDKALMVGPGPLRVRPGMVNSAPAGWVYDKPPLACRPNQAHRG